jgi:hypothetical protein
MKPRTELLAGKIININHGKSCVWGAKAITLQATEDKNEDTRPYSVRRLDAKLCDQDVASGFKDRRLRLRIVINMGVPAYLIAPALYQTAKPLALIQQEAKAEAKAKAKKEKQEKQEQAQKQADIKKMNQFIEERELNEKKRLEKPVIKNPEILIKMAHLLRCNPNKITDEYYRDNLQRIREEIRDSHDLQMENERKSDQIHYEAQVQPTRRRRTIVA